MFIYCDVILVRSCLQANIKEVARRSCKCVNDHENSPPEVKPIGGGRGSSNNNYSIVLFTGAPLIQLDNIVVVLQLCCNSNTTSEKKISINHQINCILIYHVLTIHVLNNCIKHASIEIQ